MQVWRGRPRPRGVSQECVSQGKNNRGVPNLRKVGHRIAEDVLQPDAACLVQIAATIHVGASAQPSKARQLNSLVERVRSGVMFSCHNLDIYPRKPLICRTM